MKSLLLIILVFTILSCSVFKHKTESISSQKDLTMHIVQEIDSVQLLGQSQQVRFLSSDKLVLTEIIPEGKFVYQPDSGFRGSARSLRVYRKTQQRSLENDTSSLRLAANGDRRGVDSIVHEQAQEQLEEQKQSRPIAIWVYAVVLLILLTINFGWKKIFKNS